MSRIREGVPCAGVAPTSARAGLSLVANTCVDRIRSLFVSRHMLVFGLALMSCGCREMRSLPKLEVYRAERGRPRYLSAGYNDLKGKIASHMLLRLVNTLLQYCNFM